jgi:uncharacterized protein (TIGR03083 family)
LQTAEHMVRLRAEGALFTQAATAAGLDAAVPTCPGWRVRDLVRHLGGVHRWATSYIVTGNPSPSSEKADVQYFAAIGDAELLPAYLSAHATLVEALAGASPDLACWAFLAASSPLAFWTRRQAHETTIHRVDAEIAAGMPSSCAADFSADGIDELLNGFFGRTRGRLVCNPAVALAVRATDTGDAWTIRIEPDRRVVTAGADDADCTVSGAAAELYLLLWNRRMPGEGLAVEGNPRVLKLWRTKAVIT